MTTPVSTSVTASFSPDGAAPSLVMERSSKTPDNEDEVFFRVHGGAGYQIFSTSGQVIVAQKNLRRFTSEFVYFNNSRLAALRYPGALNRKIVPFGKFFNENGQQVSAKFFFDAAKNSVMTENQAIYGVVLVEYDAPYDMWRAKFGGVCPTIESYDPLNSIDGNSPDEDRPYEGRDPMVVYAAKGSVVASLPLDPPPCDLGDSSAISRSKDNSQTPQLVVEIDPEKPIRYTDRGRVRPEAEATVRVYPAETLIDVAVSAGKLGKDRIKGVRQVKERITFSGSSSVTMTYPPLNKNISVEVVSRTFVDVWGRTFTPNIALWGDTVTIVDRPSKFVAQNPIQRKVRRGEIVVTNLFRNAIECYGAIDISYVAEFWAYEYEFDYDSKKSVFKEAFIVASLDDQTQTLGVSGPRSEGDR